ncbi:hypothetical protein [Gimesia algae]|uniref:hypothetical protein n=1 Tax=Gimesia algae TaxID=2527971 RepID=UPI0011AAD272|nr:hypothetical protein [Gimesia algae]
MAHKSRAASIPAERSTDIQSSLQRVIDCGNSGDWKSNRPPMEGRSNFAERRPDLVAHAS